MAIRRLFIALTVLIILSSCGGGSGDTAVISVDPSGEWRVTYVSIVDECELLTGDSTSFEDGESISLTDGQIALSSEELPLEEYTGEFREDSSFTASASVTGDLFGEGFDCTLAEAIAYNDLTESSANAVYEVKIICDDGTRCDSLLRGLAERVS